MSPGKAAAQASHAAVDAREKLDEEVLSDWQDELRVRVVLGVGNIKEMRKKMHEAYKKDINVGYIIDKGLTEVGDETMTACAIGPADEDKIDKITGDLNTY